MYFVFSQKDISHSCYSSKQTDTFKITVCEINQSSRPELYNKGKHLQWRSFIINKFLTYKGLYFMYSANSVKVTHF